MESEVIFLRSDLHAVCILFFFARVGQRPDFAPNHRKKTKKLPIWILEGVQKQSRFILDPGYSRIGFLNLIEKSNLLMWALRNKLLVSW